MNNRFDELKTSGLRATLPRLKVLEVFQRAGDRHLSAEDVYRIILSEGADIGLATIYRVLVQFTEAGLLNRLHFEGGRAVFELNEGQHHDHMVCLQCGMVQEFFDEVLERRQREIAEERGFVLQEHSLAMYGFCSSPSCRKGGQLDEPAPRRAHAGLCLSTLAVDNVGENLRSEGITPVANGCYATSRFFAKR